MSLQTHTHTTYTQGRDICGRKRYEGKKSKERFFLVSFATTWNMRIFSPPFRHVGSPVITYADLICPFVAILVSTIGERKRVILFCSYLSLARACAYKKGKRSIERENVTEWWK